MEHPGRETRILEVQPKAGEDFQKRRTSLVAEAPDTLPRERNVVRIVLRGEGFLREFGGSAGRRLRAFDRRISRFVRTGIASPEDEASTPIQRAPEALT